MSKKIIKSPPSTSSWGEDVFALLTAQSLGSTELTKSAEQAIETRYRLELRTKFQKDTRVNNALVESKDCLLTEGTYESIRGLVKDVIRQGTEEIFDRILRELLEELDAMHKREPSAYLVNMTDGKVLMPIEAKDVYTPPSYVGEDGITRPAKPILHPAISAPLTMYAQQENLKREAITRATNPSAVEHLVQGPESIISRARDLLRHQGIEVEPVDNGKTATIEVGRERIDDMLQSPNYGFHRSQMYGSLLAKKVIDLLKGKGQCYLKNAVLRKGSKEQWYEVSLEIVP